MALIDLAGEQVAPEAVPAVWNRVVRTPYVRVSIYYSHPGPAPSPITLN